METITVLYDPNNGNYIVNGPFNLIVHAEILNSVSGHILRTLRKEGEEVLGSSEPEVLKQYIEFLKTSKSYQNN